MRSFKARPNAVQNMINSQPMYTIFIAPGSKQGAKMTGTADAAKEFSEDKAFWHPLPKALSQVTGRIDNYAAALVFDVLQIADNGWLNLWDYADFYDDKKPIRFMQGCSAFCAIKKDTSFHPKKLKSNLRRIIAVGRLVEPYCVWLR